MGISTGPIVANAQCLIDSGFSNLSRCLFLFSSLINEACFRRFRYLSCENKRKNKDEENILQREKQLAEAGKISHVFFLPFSPRAINK